MLTSSIDRYLELRRALGYKLDTTEYRLRSFTRLADERDEMQLRSQTALEWAARATTARQSDRRLCIVIGFARFLHAEDSHHEIPAREAARPAPTRPKPHIFSPEEIQRVGQAALRLPPQGSLRPMTFNTLFNLIAVTGLRISEALKLRIDDFTPDGLIIRETKFHKSRLVPLHETTEAAIARYLERRHASQLHPTIFLYRCVALHCATPRRAGCSGNCALKPASTAHHVRARRGCTICATPRPSGRWKTVPTSASK